MVLTMFINSPLAAWEEYSDFSSKALLFVLYLLSNGIYIFLEVHWYPEWLILV